MLAAALRISLNLLKLDLPPVWSGLGIQSRNGVSNGMPMLSLISCLSAFYCPKWKVIRPRRCFLIVIFICRKKWPLRVKDCKEVALWIKRKFLMRMLPKRLLVKIRVSRN